MPKSQQTNLNSGQRSRPSSREKTVITSLEDGAAAYHDFQRHGSLESLDQAIMYFRNATETAVEDDPYLPTALNNLAMSLLNRFEQLGHSIDIDEAVLCHQAAVDLLPQSHPNRPTYLYNLGTLSSPGSSDLEISPTSTRQLYNIKRL